MCFYVFVYSPVVDWLLFSVNVVADWLFMGVVEQHAAEEMSETVEFELTFKTWGCGPMWPAGLFVSGSQM